MMRKYCVQAKVCQYHIVLEYVKIFRIFLFQNYGEEPCEMNARLKKVYVFLNPEANNRYVCLVSLHACIHVHTYTSLGLRGRNSKSFLLLCFI